jgi:hypothetical protein
MYKVIKLKRTNKLKKNGNKRKNIKHHKLTKQLLGKAVPKQPLKISRSQTTESIGTEAIVKGGGTQNSKEKFEVKRLDDIDYSQFSLSKYLDTDIDWGTSPGPPPTDCCIL